MPWYLYLALRQLFPAGRKLGSSFFVLSVMGVALGVAVLLVVQSVMGGFGMVHRERIIDTTGHLDITLGGRPFGNTDAMMARLDEHPDVVSATPYAQGFVLARAGNIPMFPAVYGIDLQREPVLNIQGFLVAGYLEDLYDETILISSSLARRLGVWVGSELEIFSPTLIDHLGEDSILLPSTFEIVGIYDIEWNQDFTPGIVFTLRTMQDLYELEGTIHGIAVRLKDNVDENKIAAQLRTEWRYWQVNTWRERWADFLWVLDLEKTMMLFINLFIVAVAVFAIAVAQLLMVVRKTREIGLLNAMGARRGELPAIYCLQGFIIGVVGLILGILLATSLLSVRDPIIHFLSGISGTRDTLTRFYYFTNLPVHYQVSDFVIIGIAAVTLSTLASLLPAMKAARMKPADSLRIEQ